MLLTNQLANAAIFLVDSACQHFDTHFITICVTSIVALLSVFPSCYFSFQITADLNETAKVIYFSAWYSLPMEQKKIIPFIVAFAQIGHTFSANALLCSLESFVQVILDYHYLAKLK